MKKSTCLIALMIGLFVSLSAQQDQTLFTESGVRLTGAWVGPSVAGTLVDGNIVRQTGGQFGLEFNKRLFVGFGTNNVDYPITNNAQIDFSYSGLLFGITPRSYKAIHPTFSILAGGGNFGFSTDPNRAKSDIWVAQPVVGLEFNVFRWFRIGLSGGYRLGFFVGDEFPNVTSSDLSAPFGAVNFRFGFSWGE